MMMTMIAPILLAGTAAADKKDDVNPVPLTSPGTWFDPSQYPPEALIKKQEGRVAFKLLISQDGTPKSCEVTTSSGFASLDTATCSIAMRSARFKPDSNKASRSFSIGVVWKRPDGYDLAASGKTPISSMVVKYTLNANGLASDCHVDNPYIESLYGLKASACSLIFKPELRNQIAKDLSPYREVDFYISHTDLADTNYTPNFSDKYVRTQEILNGVYYNKNPLDTEVYRCPSRNITLGNADAECTGINSYAAIVFVGLGKRLFGVKIVAGYLPRVPGDGSK